MDFILASRSPRRQELLRHIVEQFEVRPSDADETIPAGLSPQAAVRMLARKKAEALNAATDTCVVIGSDTIVVSPHGEIFGIPQTAQDADRMLRTLSGATHTVMTGVCLLGGGMDVDFCEQTQVRFADLTDAEIAEYIASGEPFDKAGAYGIQGKAAKFIEKIDGDYYTVMGLPVAAIYKELKKIL